MLIEMNSKLKFVKEFREQLTQQVDTHRNDMVKVWNESTEKILDKLEV